MGVLVGTSLIVIIPEGVETLYSASDAPHAHSRRSLRTPSLDTASLAGRSPSISHGGNRYLAGNLWQRNADNTEAFSALPGPVIPAGLDPNTFPSTDPPKTPTAPNEIGILDMPSKPHPATPPSTESEPHKRTPHAWIGLSLTLGFILMYLLDTLPSLASPAPPSRAANIYSLSDLSTSNSPSSSAPSTQSQQRTLSTTLGLVIHAAADGIALGASSTQPSLSFIIFLAIMIHKAPAAFGLTSVLLRQGLGKRAARAHLVVFSLAAPVGAVGTWMVVRVLGGGGGAGLGGEEAMRWWTGVLLLFSGGTFLYVAMHTMQGDDSAGGYEESNGNGYLDGSHAREPARPEEGKSLRLVLAAVGGMLLPLVTQIGHVH
ncbi:hypothetical protein MMC06_000024 [Schaereria dolodes]|nr:hypothetical protein [Schaereria dolodes]